jgi:autotransporter-associated beta strand protein
MKPSHGPFLGSLLALALSQGGDAATHTFTGTSAGTYNWAAGSNWDSLPTSATDTTLSFTSSLAADVALVSNNDAASPPFKLNALGFTNAGPATGNAPTLTLQGGQLEFVSNGATTPTITFNTTGTVKPSITVNNALLLTNNLSVNATSDGRLGGPLTGTGILTKTGAGHLTLSSAANTYSGTTAINAGTLQVTAGATMGATTGALTMGTGSSGVIGTVGNLTLEENATKGTFSVASNTANISGSNIGMLSIADGKALTVSSLAVGVSQGSTNNPINTALATGSANAGTLTVSGDATVGLSAGGSGSVAVTMADLSGLAHFNAGSGAGNFRVGYGALNRATLTLASTANVINVAAISVGETTANSNSGQNNILNLGAGTNALQATTINIGTQKASGVIQFAGSSGTVSIGGTGGTGTSNISLGNNNSSGSYQPGNLNNGLLLAGHAATINAGTVIIGNRTSTGAGTITARMTFDTGTFNASSITLARATSGHGSSATAVNGTLTLGSDSTSTGIANVSGNVLLASHTSSAAGVQTATGVLNILGGTLNANTAASPSGGILDNSTTTTGAHNTTLTLNGGTLNLNGGVIGGNGSSGNRAITNLNFQSGTLKNVAQINHGAGLAKTSAGTLVLEGDNAYGGITAVSEGVLDIRSATALGATSAGTTVSTGAALQIQGGITTATEALSLNGSGVSNSGALRNISGNNTYSGAITLGSAARIQSDAGTLTLDVAAGNAISASNHGVAFGGAGHIEIKDSINLGSGGLDKTGNGTLTLAAGVTHSYTGATNITQGRLVLNGNISSSLLTSIGDTATLGGSGSTGDLSILNGGTLAPGNSAGSLTIAGDLGLDATSILAFELNPSNMTVGANINDLVSVAGNLTLDGLLSLSATSGDFSAVTGGSWRLFDYSGTLTNNLLTLNSMPGLASGYSWSLDTATPGQVNLAVVPEPRAALLGGLGMLLLLRRRRA